MRRKAPASASGRYRGLVRGEREARKMVRQKEKKTPAAQERKAAR
jgi:hypothetical protein